MKIPHPYSQRLSYLPGPPLAAVPFHLVGVVFSVSSSFESVVVIFTYVNMCCPQTLPLAGASYVMFSSQPFAFSFSCSRHHSHSITAIWSSSSRTEESKSTSIYFFCRKQVQDCPCLPTLPCYLTRFSLSVYQHLPRLVFFFTFA